MRRGSSCTIVSMTTQTAPEYGWKILVAFLLGLLLGVSGGWLAFHRQETDSSPSSVVSGKEEKVEPLSAVKNVAPQTREVTDVGATVSVSSQMAGDSVVVQSLTVNQPSWAVVYEDYSGQPGNALGALRLVSGSHSNFSIPLLRNTVPSMTYHVVVHMDNGDRVFNLADDFPVRDQNSAPVMATFTTLP